jgi:hypothetical protein
MGCGLNVRWMEEYCLDDDRGTSEDWMAFFWNLWSNGTYRYSINHITNVWEETDPSYEGGYNIGEKWSSSDPDDSTLVKTVNTLWPGSENFYKRQQFINKGDNAGVDH